MSETVLYIVQILGVVAFAASGALVAMNKHMDIFGIATLGVVTATGGGLIRDLILGITPPNVFVTPDYALIAIITSLVMFLKPVRSFLQKEEKVFEVVLLFVDTVGLSIFCMLGIQIAYSVSSNYNVFLLSFVGLVSGTGGSILRDVLAGQTPFIFVKHFYANAALIGSIIASILWEIFGEIPSMIIGGIIIMILRFLAAKYRWKLPRA